MAQLPDDHFSGARNIHHKGAKGLTKILNGKIDRAAIAGIAAIPTPSTATAPVIASKVNEILAALKLL